MPTTWVITAPSDHIALDDAQQGQITFTVTNPTSRVDRVVFDIVPGDDADPAWFSIEEPQRRVPPNGSVSYLMTTQIPPDAPPGTYSVRGRVYSADSAPEEGSVLSGRLAVEVKPKAAPEKRRRLPWWVFVVAGLVVITLVVVLVLVFAGGGKPQPQPSRSLPPSVKVPDLNHQSQSQATTNLSVFGLSVGAVRHVLSPTPDQVVYQSVPGGSTVPRGTTVDLVVTTSLAAPKPVTPQPNASVPLASVRPQTSPVPSTPPLPSPSASENGKKAAHPAKTTEHTGLLAPPPDVLRWDDPDAFVGRWQVTIRQKVHTDVDVTHGNLRCVYPPMPPFYPSRVLPCQVVSGNLSYFYLVTYVTVQVDRPGYTPILTPNAPASILPGSGPPMLSSSATADFQWQVAAIDDFGNVGPGSAWIWFTVK